MGSQVNGHYCRFLDGNRFNSRPENLCWITAQDAFAHPECAPPTAFRTPPQTSAMMMSASGLTFSEVGCGRFTVDWVNSISESERHFVQQNMGNFVYLFQRDAS